MCCFFSVYISASSIDSGLKGQQLVKAEAKSMIENINKWSGFLSILSLSSVLGLKIFTYYPDSGLEKYKSLFNQEIFPWDKLNSFLSLHILFCDLGVQSIPFKPNHFAPLFFKTESPIWNDSSLQECDTPKKDHRVSTDTYILNYYQKSAFSHTDNNNNHNNNIVNSSSSSQSVPDNNNIVTSSSSFQSVPDNNKNIVTTATLSSAYCISVSDSSMSSR